MPLPALAAAHSPTVQGRYAIERELGRGGMATVYLAEDRKLHRQVALKVLRPELGASIGGERFLREIEIVARLAHPHILTLYDCGEAEGRLFYAMPYVEGESLRERLRREPQLPVADAIAILTAVAGALDYAHRAGIIHRDIKPENILLARDPSGGVTYPLVADFGVARALSAAGGERLTETGLAVGTPTYMSPEQATAGGHVDGRSDVYALGCVAYEMLAGVPPFVGPTAQAVRTRHAVDPVPSLRTVRPGVPEAVERAIEHALAKVPADRFATAGAFAQALTAEAPPAPGRRRRLRLSSAGHLLGIAAGVVAAVAAIVVGERLRKSSASTVAPFAARIAVLPFAAASGDTGLTRLGRDLAVTVSASLDGVGGVQTADRLTVADATADRPSLSVAEGAALARRLGASSFVRGTLAANGDDVVLDLDLYATADLATLAQGIRITGRRDSVATLTDSVTWVLLRRAWQRGKPPSPSLAAVTTHSLPALRAFLEGERELGSNRWAEAALAFRSAMAADSTFWLAYWRYEFARNWQGAPFEREVFEALRQHRDLLPERERLLVAAHIDSMGLEERLERLRAVTERFPDYWPGWFQYADLIAHSGTHVGYDLSESLAAFRRALALNPRLVPAWEHIYTLTAGRDQPEADRALARLRELGAPGLDDQVFRLTDGVARAGGVIPPHLDGLADSLAALMTGHRFVARYGYPQASVLEGYPIARLDLSRRVLSLPGINPGVPFRLLFANAVAWAARGQWDSALTLMSKSAAEHPDVLGRRGTIDGAIVIAVESYGFAVLGAWVGATPPALAEQRRPVAVRTIASAVPDEGIRADARGRLAWLDGLLGYTRGDRRAIETARQAAASSGYSHVKLVDRSLAAFDRALAGDRTGAGRELAALEEEAANDEYYGMDFTPQIAVERLAAAQWLQDAGDVERAARLLRWQDTYVWQGLMQLDFSEALDGPTYLVRARLEEARGDAVGARRYYQRFLQVYDRPLPSLAHLVEEAKAAVVRLEADR